MGQRQACRAPAQPGGEDSGPLFLTRFSGGFTGILRWAQLDALWERLYADTQGDWYIYAVGAPPPTMPAQPGEMARFLDEMRALLQKDHAEDFCGLVYVDNREVPAFIKIYDPNNLGVVCGFSDSPPLPGWVLSKLPPVDLPNALPPPANRRSWWRRLFG